MALIPDDKKEEAERVLKGEGSKSEEGSAVSHVIIRIRDLLRHLKYLEEKLDKDLHDSMKHLEKDARVKV